MAYLNTSDHDSLSKDINYANLSNMIIYVVNATASSSAYMLAQQQLQQQFLSTRHM